MRNRRAGTWPKIELPPRIVPALVEDRRGVTAIEYALIAALIAVAAIAAMSTLGGSISGTFTQVANSI